jgi:hypothetical protein
MSTAESWDVVVPEDDAELLAELRRHGVRPGKHLYVLETGDDQSVDSDQYRQAVKAAVAAAAAVASANSHVAEALRAAIGPQLEALSASTAVLGNVRVQLDATERAALISVARALEDALGRTSARTAEPKAADRTEVRREMPFIGSVPGGPRDLAARTDDYLRQGFGR